MATLVPDTTEAQSGDTPAPWPHRSCCWTAVSAARDKEAGPGHPGPIPLFREFQSPTPTKGAKTAVSLLPRSGLGTRESPQDSPTGPGRTGQQTCPAWPGTERRSTLPAGTPTHPRARLSRDWNERLWNMAHILWDWGGCAETLPPSCCSHRGRDNRSCGLQLRVGVQRPVSALFWLGPQHRACCTRGWPGGARGESGRSRWSLSSGVSPQVSSCYHCGRPSRGAQGPGPHCSLTSPRLRLAGTGSVIPLSWPG